MEASWTDRVKNEEVLQRFKTEGSIIRGINRRKAKWACHRFPRNCLPQALLKERYKRRKDEEKSYKQLLDAHKKTKRSGEFKENALDRALWRTRL